MFNLHLPVAWMLYSIIADDPSPIPTEETYRKMYISLLTIVASKAAGKAPFTILPWMMYKMARTSHFKRINAAGQMQNKTYIDKKAFEEAEKTKKDLYDKKIQYCVQEGFFDA